MTTRYREQMLGRYATAASRVTAALRLLLLVPLGLSILAAHQHSDERAFVAVLAAYAAWAVGWVVLVFRTSSRAWFAPVATAVDLVVVTALAALSGGPSSEVRHVFFLIPIATAFRYRPALTATVGLASLFAFLSLPLFDPAAGAESGTLRVAIHAADLLWLALACTLLSRLLVRRATRVQQLLDTREQLVAQAVGAEERERQALAESLHDSAIQSLLSARHDLEDAGVEHPSVSLERADAAILACVHELREAVFELHPYVLDEAGLAVAVRRVAQRAAQRGGFELTLDLDDVDRAVTGPGRRLMFSAARELLANAAQHAHANRVSVELRRRDGEVRLAVTDDGVGLDPDVLATRVADGHIGLASHYVRVETAGGRFDVAARPGGGTRAEVVIPGVSAA